MSTTTDAPTAAITEIQALGAELTARDRWTRDQVDALQRARTRGIIAHAVAASPYYRDALGADAVDCGPRDASDAPQGRVDGRVRPHRHGSSAAVRGTRAPSDGHRGAGALPRRIPRLRNVGQQRPPRHHGLHRAGVPMLDCGLRAHVRPHRPRSRRARRRDRRARAAAHHPPALRGVSVGSPGAPRLTVSTPLAEIVAAVERYQADAIIGYPTIAALLADEQLEGRLRIAPRTVLMGSEPLTDEMRGRITQAWASVRPRCMRPRRPRSSRAAALIIPASASATTWCSSRSSIGRTGRCPRARPGTRSCSRTS